MTKDNTTLVSSKGNKSDIAARIKQIEAEQAMDLVRKSLNAGDASTRAAALEAFETLGDKRITNEVLPILDRGGVFRTDAEQHMSLADVIGELLSAEEPWLRALAVYVVSEQRLFNFKSDVRKLTYDAVPLVKDAARNAVSQMDGTIIMKKIVNVKTLKTLSTLDRILLLREVPMFSGLAPEDLGRIAEVADEQLFSDQALLCVEGEPGNTLFIIATGKIDGDATLTEVEAKTLQIRAPVLIVMEDFLSIVAPGDDMKQGPRVYSILGFLTMAPSGYGHARLSIIKPVPIPCTAI